MSGIQISKIKLKLKYLLFFISGLLIILFLILLLNKNKTIQLNYSAAFLDVNTAYADTTLHYISSEEKAEQMIIADFGKIDNSKNDSITKLLYQIMPGGLIFNTDSIDQYIKYQNIIQKYSKINPFIFLPEKSDIFHFKETETFPNFDILSAIKNDSIKNKYISTISKIAKQINLSSLFSDDLLKKYSDVDCRVLSSLINRINTSKKLMSFENASRFIDTDSIQFIINSDFISDGLTGIILNEDDNSNIIIQIKNKYRFDGLFIKRISPAELNSDSVAALINAGNDLFITDKPELLKRIIMEVSENEQIDEDLISLSVRKILLAKTLTGLENNRRILHADIDHLLHSPATVISSNDVYRNSIALIKNNNDAFPIKSLKNAHFNLLIIGKNNLNVFKKTFNSYYPAKSLFLDISTNNYIDKIRKFKNKNSLIIVLNDIKIDTAFVNAVLENKNRNSTVLLNFGKPENLKYTDIFNTVFQLHGNSEQEQKYAAETLFGGINITGKSSCKVRKYVMSDTILKIRKTRVSECLPEKVGVNSNVLRKIDSVAKDGIRKGAFPGCQIVVFKNGYNIYDKSFGYQTYEKRKRVRKTDLYDLASVTKIAATTTAAMKLYSLGKIKLNDKLGKFFKDTKIDYSNIKPDTIINIDTLKYVDVKDFKKILKHQDTIRINDSMLIAYDSLIFSVSPKNNIFQVRIRDLLLHKSGITPTLPILPYVIFKKNFYDSLEINKQKFYEKIKADTTLIDKKIVFNPKKEVQKIYDTYFTKIYIRDSAEIKIAAGFFLKNAWFDTLWRDTKRLRVYSRKIYQYSDINMILLQSAIDSLNHKSMNNYMRNTFYLPMGLRSMCYKPRKYFSENRIVPTEDDKYWREQLLRGNVHDPSAAMLGGISGNAGLFSDAHDLAVLGQMWLNGGTYGGIRFIPKSVIKKFTGFQENSFRGLGFDKPHKKAIIAKDAPLESFGHTGFTGTCIWVDPINEIVFVFLSNRVNPSAKNWRINTLKIRQKIHQLVYDSMKIQT